MTDSPEAKGKHDLHSLPELPFPPSSIERGETFFPIQHGALQKDSDVVELIGAMWENPTSHFYYYHRCDGSQTIDRPLFEAIQRNDIAVPKEERHYYDRRIPAFPGNYERIEPGTRADTDRLARQQSWVFRKSCG